MKYTVDPWRDQIYRVIHECLSDANFEPIRADEIPTSERSADEVADLLRKSLLVVFDTSGDSLNVAYELGFCHGVQKDAKQIILLRKKSGGENSFSFRHYRCLFYRDSRHLRSLLRSRLGLLGPLANSQLGMGINIDRRGSNEPAYGAIVAKAIANVIAESRFSGRCEYYAGDGFVYGDPDAYIVGLGLVSLPSKRVPTYKWWERFLDRLQFELSIANTGLTVDRSKSELGAMSGIRSWYIHCGAVQFTKGVAVKIINKSDSDSWFSSEMADRISAPSQGVA